MRTDLISRHGWFDNLTAGNMRQVGDEIARRFKGERHITIIIDNPANQDVELYPDEKFVEHSFSGTEKYTDLMLRFTNRRLYFSDGMFEQWYVVFDGPKITFKRIRTEDTRPFRVYIYAYDAREDV